MIFNSSYAGHRGKNCLDTVHLINEAIEAHEYLSKRSVPYFDVTRGEYLRLDDRVELYRKYNNDEAEEYNE